MDERGHGAQGGLQEEKTNLGRSVRSDGESWPAHKRREVNTSSRS